MDYFKSISSAASSVLSSAKSGPFPNYNIGNELVEYRSQTIWSLHHATQKDNGTPCTVIAFDTAQPYNANRSNLLPLAKNAARKLRTTRHPNVLRLLDTAETNTAVYIAVEKATPLSSYLAQHSDARATPQQQDWIVWGLSSIMSAVKFLHTQAASTHGNLRPESIFLSSSGEWKLAGFESLTPHAESPHGLLFTHASLIPDSARYAPPEVKQNGWNVLASMDSTLLDSYSLALVAIEAFNGTLPPQTSTSVPPRGHVPQPVYAMLQRMLVPNAKNRMTVEKVVDAGEAEGGFFKENTLVKVARGLDGFLLASENEKAAIIRLLREKPDSFNPEFLTYKVLPALVGALSHAPPAGTVPSASLQASTLLPLVLRLAQPLSKDEWSTSMVPPLLKAYTSPDRSTRMALLDNLPLYADRMDNKVVVDKVWPNLITGFNDSVAVIREATLKAILPLAPKLSDRVLNNDLLRLLARMQVDPEAGIRTNTTILLGRLAPHLSLSTRKKVLIPAFSRSLKDTFVHARVAGVMALMATGDSYDHEDAAKHILPAVAPGLVDKEKLVRDQADKAVKMFLKVVEEGVKRMPDTVLPPEQAAGSGDFDAAAPSAATQAAASMASTAGSAASALAGWAMSSALSSFASTSNGEAAPKASQVTPSSAFDLNSSMDGRSTPAMQTQLSASGSREARLSTSSSASSFVPVASPYNDALDYDFDENPAASAPRTGTAVEAEKDLMDVNDDTADWSSFEIGQPKKKAASIGKTRMNRAPANAAAVAAAAARKSAGVARASKLGITRNASSSSLAAPATTAAIDPKRALSSSSLKVAPAAAVTGGDDDAWGDSWGDAQESAPAKNGSVAPAIVATAPASAALASPKDSDSGANSLAASQELIASAFRAPVPRELAIASPSTLPSTPVLADPVDSSAPAPAPAPATSAANDEQPIQEAWASFDDGGDDEEDASQQSKKPASPAAVALTREEKKAELERKRLERRNRLAQLKEEKEKARLQALGKA
ncbi:Nuclear aminoacylation-dependent tRNA export pathway component [Thecaphora frezii]